MSPTHRCPSCGHTVRFVITHATMDVAFTVACPGCGSEMDRLDALGEIEAASRGDKPALNLRDAIRKGWFA